jgi:hypothetical protein
MANGLLHNKPTGKYYSLCMSIERRGLGFSVVCLFTGVSTLLFNIYTSGTMLITIHKHKIVAVILACQSLTPKVTKFGRFDIYEIEIGGTRCLDLPT